MMRPCTPRCSAASIWDWIKDRPARLMKLTVFHISLSFPVPENQEFAGGIVDNDHHDI